MSGLRVDCMSKARQAAVDFGLKISNTEHLHHIFNTIILLVDSSKYLERTRGKGHELTVCGLHE